MYEKTNAGPGISVKPWAGLFIKGPLKWFTVFYIFKAYSQWNDRDSDLLWVQCTSMDLFTVSVCISDSDIAIAKSEMGATPKLSNSD